MAAALNMLHCGINKLHHICHGVLHICTHCAIMLCANHGSGQSMDGTTPDGTTLLAQSMDCASSHSTSGLLTFRLAFSLSPGRNVPFRAWWISSIRYLYNPWIVQVATPHLAYWPSDWPSVFHLAAMFLSEHDGLVQSTSWVLHN